jgi:hypothetical protein
MSAKATNGWIDLPATDVNNPPVQDGPVQLPPAPPMQDLGSLAAIVAGQGARFAIIEGELAAIRAALSSVQQRETSGTQAVPRR